MFPPGAVPVQNLPPEMLRALQASLAEAFQDRDAARRQFFNGNAAVSDDAVDAALPARSLRVELGHVTVTTLPLQRRVVRV